MARSPIGRSPGATGLHRSLAAQSRQRRETLADIQTAETSRRGNGHPALDLKIENLLVADLKPANRRVRRSNAAQIAKVRASLERFGVVAPVLIDREDRVVHGHVVVEAARALGLITLPCVRLDHLSADEARLLAITLNRLSETGEWDVEALKIELQELVVLDEPLTITGFDEPVLDALLTDDDDVDPVSDPLPPIERVAVSRRGDVWRLGDHRLAHGDAREQTLLADLLGGEDATLGFVDPPYNVPIAHHVSSQGHREFAMASGEMTEEAFIAFLQDAFAALWSILAAGGLLLSFMDWRGLLAMTSAARAVGFEELNLLVWAKTNAGMGSLWRSQHELIGAYKKPGAAHINNVELGKSGRWRSNVWRYPGASSLGSDARDGLDGHPTPKPIALLVDGILDVTHRGDIVVDTFSGSGSTLIACERSGRRFRGVEFDALYVDLAIRRWQAETGQVAVLADTGQTFDEAATERALGLDPAAVPPIGDPPERRRVRVPAGSSKGRG